MKKLIFLICLLFPVFAWADAGLIGEECLTPSGGCICGTSITDCTASESNADLYGDTYMGASWSATSGDTLCAIIIEIKTNLSASSQTLTVRAGTSSDLTGESDAGTYVLGAGTTGDITIEIDSPIDLTTATWYWAVKSSNTSYGDRITLEVGYGTACSSGLRQIDNNVNGTWDMVDDAKTWDIEAGLMKCN